LQAYGPSGVFTPSSHPANKSLYLSAGSGVTPLMSMTRAGHDLGLNRDIVFLHSARTPEDIIFRRELSQLSASANRLKVVHVCEGIGLEDDWNGPVGRLSLELLEAYVPDFREREAFTCGPAGYMKSVRELLAHGGHDPARYHQESFDISASSDEGSVTAIPALSCGVTAEGRHSFSVRLARSGKTFTMDDTRRSWLPLAKRGYPCRLRANRGFVEPARRRFLRATSICSITAEYANAKSTKGYGCSAAAVLNRTSCWTCS
jgi:ferredoxin-NADP reductase